MTGIVDREHVTRFAADLFDAAAAEGARQSRSGEATARPLGPGGARRVRPAQRVATTGEAALRGELAMTSLSVEEGVVVQRRDRCAIDESLARTDYAATLAAEGLTTVALDEHGDARRIRPGRLATSRTA